MGFPWRTVSHNQRVDLPINSQYSDVQFLMASSLVPNKELGVWNTIAKTIAPNHPQKTIAKTIAPNHPLLIQTLVTPIIPSMPIHFHFPWISMNCLKKKLFSIISINFQRSIPNNSHHIYLLSPSISMNFHSKNYVFSMFFHRDTEAHVAVFRQQRHARI